MSGTGEPDAANPHPDKRVPAIKDGDTIVAELVGIVLYLTDAFPAAGLGPVPGDPQRGAYLTWLAWYAAEMEPVIFAHFGNELAGNPMKQRNYDAVIRRLETAFDKASFLLGDHFSAADLLVSSAIAFGRRVFPEGRVFDAYSERCKSRPAALRAVELDTAEGVQRPG